MTPLLPKLSASARRALWVTGLLALANAAALIIQAWALAQALATVVTSGSAEISGYLGVLAIAVLARAVLGWAIEAASARASAGAKAELRALVLDSALARGPEWIQRHGAPALTTVATKGLDSLDAYFTKYLPALVTAAIVPPVVGAWILFADWISALAIMITVPLIPLFAWLVGKFTEQRTARAADSVQRLAGHLWELVRALPVLTAFGRARAQGALVHSASESHRRATTATLRVAFLSALVLELFSSLSVALVAVEIGMRLVAGDLDLATGLFVLVLAPECYLPLRAAGAAHHASEDGVEAVRRVHEVAAGAPERVRRDSESPASSEGFSAAQRGSSEVAGEVGAIRSDQRSDVDSDGVLRVRALRVARRDGYAPDGLSFTASPGKITHLDGFDGIGPSGSGKSTTFAVLLGFAEPEAGTISYGHTELGQCDPVEWRCRIAWVPQRPAFTGGTVVDELSIALADQPDQPALESTMDEVLREVAAEHLRHRRIDQLSTGQRQRVAVARALLRARGGARLLLLDEPTAHLDSAAAERVNAAIRRAAERGATVVLASHRPGSGASAAEPAEDVESEVDATTGTGTARISELITGRGALGVGLGALSLLAALALTATSAWLIARASQQPPVLALTVAAVGVRAFALSRAGLRYLERLISHDAAFQLAGRLRVRLWEALVRIGPARTARLHRGDGLARLVDDVDTIRDLVPRVLVPPLVSGIVLLGGILLQTAVLPSAGLLLAGMVGFAILAGPSVALLAERRASAAVDTGRRRVSRQVLTLLDGSAELLAFGAHAAYRRELAEQDSRLVARERRVSFGAGAATAVGTLFSGIAVVGSGWLGADAVADGRIAPELAPLLALVPLALNEALTALHPAAQQWPTLRAAQLRLAPLLAAQPEQAQSEQAQSEQAHPQQAQPEPDADVVLDEVSVRWPDARHPALRGSLRIPHGSHVAVTGPSGGGKSTLLALLLGFLPAEHGRVRAPRRLAWCPQDPRLVSTTIRENLRVAAPRASDAELVEALRSAELADWAHRLDEPVGSEGNALSGGEAQRLALARVLLVPDAELILLDEPTAHLDVPTSGRLLDRLHSALRGRTVLHVTHRAEEAERADLVLRVTDRTVSVVRDTRDAAVGGR